MNRHPSGSEVQTDAERSVGRLRAALEPRPEDVAQLLRSALAAGETAAPPTHPHPRWRNRPLLGMAGLAIVLVVAAGWIGEYPPREPNPPTGIEAALPSTGLAAPASPTLTLIGTGSSIAVQSPPGAELRETASSREANRPTGSFIFLRRLDS